MGDDFKGDSQVAGGTFHICKNWKAKLSGILNVFGGYVEWTYEMRILILVHSTLKVMKNQNKQMPHGIYLTMLFFSLQKQKSKIFWYFWLFFGVCAVDLWNENFNFSSECLIEKFAKKSLSHRICVTSEIYKKRTI